MAKVRELRGVNTHKLPVMFVVIGINHHLLKRKMTHRRLILLKR